MEGWREKGKAIIPETMASAVGCIYSHKPAIEQRG